MAWTNLSAGAGGVRGAPPPPRGGLGLAVAGGGLYVFGGWADAGGANPPGKQRPFVLGGWADQ
jgi:hypothetical protein